ncbi:3-hydroxyacyl-CoA dehydrogenase NAD-binding domain-containing protein [Variovorax sp. J22G21]|uniref:3-hydroxyacyl-CoA dehydrogenase NAD-binding domain-containing protein n=1 Tax=Variovorax fucosicus TaxID=3053517 RepID=UPI0025762D77|nr:MULTISPECIES: 3-hydroxyacyl-CoA dehydrogenase NAD-binding domain-containing protein [unclassified Variovorax]MDM0040736.1 3-hydroxyacyl-CoA dehydrogenase NAD-binding domain-containing protein [Variovorax sp. J22R193]MDM0058855.1 3-hydroxyacyl-CoA dehydrogenase NAD-binding domain-containing protein [Variovorax sp. J22G47]MDM0062109.1 3-hydroxyacyl-CoA dehydrogenase NAD-binding domain-containing protein [Variovorax sp. J22G21]
MIDYSVGSDGIAQIIWNNPNGPVNIKNAESRAAFVKAVDAAVSDPAVTGIVISSAKRDFLAGGDIDEIYSAASPEAVIANVRDIGACLRRMERAGKPVVAALNGSALGGGLELALACHYRVAADDQRLRIGLPESTLGLIPGAGGTQRLPRLIGIAPASKLMLDGKAVNVLEAKSLGIIDAIVPADELLEAARVWALSHSNVVQPWDAKGFRYRDFEPQSREGRWFFFYGWPKLRGKSPAGDLAPGALLHVLAQGLERGIDAGLEIEARYFGMVAASPSAKNRIRTSFMAANAARKLARRPAGEATFEPRRVGVIGAGLMGAGVALVCARAGLQTVLIDTTDEAAQRGKARIAKTFDGAVERKLMTPQARDAALARLEAGNNMAALAGCDLVVEAVVESVEVKSQVFRKIAEAAGPQVLIASNTSSLSINALAKGLAQPANFIGLHFFAPVDRMQLVEVILGGETSPRTHAHALDFVKLLGKTAVVVNDGPGFYTSRVVAAYTREALTMLDEGVSPALIDNAAFIAGMPIGPLAMADLTSYDLLTDILSSLQREGRGTACESDKALAAAKKLVEAARVGRKGPGGVYDYPESGKVLWAGLSEVFPPLRRQPEADEVVQRLMHVQSLETIHAIDEGIAEDAMEIDLASVLGWSYPAWRGGVLAHVDDTGLKEFVHQCDVLAERHGRRFLSPDSLRRRAETGETFHVH